MHAARIHAQNREPAAQIVETGKATGTSHAVERRLLPQGASSRPKAAIGPSPAKSTNLA
jgi:hypothetical protein